MLDIKALSKKLILRDGIWQASSSRAVSYHDDGHANCYQIEDNSFWFVHRNDCIKAAIKNYPPSDNTMFDVGGGNGFVSKALEDAGVEVCLIEPGLQGVKNAQARGLKNIIHASLQDAEFNQGELASIGLFDVIEHIDDDVSFINSVYESLKPGGRVYITVPAHQMLWSQHDVSSGHYRRYSKDSISALVEGAGFKIEYATYFFSLLVIPNLILRAIPMRLGMVKNNADTTTKKAHHVDANNVFSKLVSLFWKSELNKIQNSKLIRIGNSCLVIAQK